MTRLMRKIALGYQSLAEEFYREWKRDPFDGVIMIFSLLLLAAFAFGLVVGFIALLISFPLVMGIIIFSIALVVLFFFILYRVGKQLS